jgi:tetratricopeptide (TPR) repeat protein
MKPRVFIGSSVEGLGIAYSIQQNLTFDADVTVWDQGVFELSKTTIESLLDILDKSDFGIFVFNKDDMIKMRQKNENVVRDNVLFEFGLFIGKLGRERVFFVIPARTNLHLPSDLLGITPGKYDPNREDKSTQAATGPVCHQIRIQIKQLGVLNTIDETSKEPDHKDLTVTVDNWTDFFIKKEYPKAIEVLEKELTGLTDNNKILVNRKWTAYCKFKENESIGTALFDELLSTNKDNIKAHIGIARLYLWSDYFDKAIHILEQAIKQFDDNQELKIVLSECYKKTDGDEKALKYLLENSPEKNIDIALEIANIYMDQKLLVEARNVVHTVYNNWPSNEKIRYKYARIAMDLELNNIALFFLDSLNRDFPNKSDYLGYLGNCYLNLDLYDLALSSYRKANELAKENEEWIISNIGNALKNKGFCTESIQYFEKGIELAKSSNYAHERLASAIKQKEEEEQKGLSLVREGRKQLRQYQINK